MTFVLAAADEARFWSLLESAWSSLGDKPDALRRRLLQRTPGAYEPWFYDLDPWRARVAVTPFPTTPATRRDPR